MGNIEKYGVVALLFVIVMVLAVSIWGPRSMETASLDGKQKTEGPPLIGDPSKEAKPEDITAKPLAAPIEEKGPVAIPLNSNSPASDPVAGAADGKPAKYKIQKGDTLEDIASRHLGSKNKWQEIVKMNEGLNPSRLKVGQEILLPSASGAPEVAVLESSAHKEKEKKTPTASPEAGKKPYKTVKGDTLSGIATKSYGSSGQWKKIYEANKDKIRDPEMIPEGISLNIP